MVSLTATLLLLGVRQLSATVIETFANQGVILVEKAASFIDGDAFEALSKSLDKNDPFYEEIRVQLFALKEISGSEYLYTAAQKEGHTWVYIIDGSTYPEDEEHFAELGYEYDTEDYDEAFRRVLVSGKTEVTGLVCQGEWGWLISVYTPIFNSAGKIVGIVACDYNGQDLRDAIVSIETQQIIIGIISIIIGLIMLTFITRMIFKPIKEINSILTEIAEGDGDLTKRIKLDKENEIGNLAFSFNMTLDKIKALFIIVKNATKILSDTGNELSSNMTETAAAVNEITANVQSIKGRIINQSTSVSETHATMEQVVVNIDKLNVHVEEQSTYVAQASSAIEEMVANTRSVTDTLIKNAANVKALKETSEAGHLGLQEVSADIKEIAHESEGLLAINSVMENISSQTNLLSMNAAIEAAHAGESGKGFAVVAGEIRKLAESSGEQSKTIGIVLKKMKDSIDKITRSTENVMDKFRAIDSNVKTVTEQEHVIRNAMEEQGAGSKQVLDGVGNVNEITRHVRSGSLEMLEGSKEVIQESTNLEKITQEITNGMNEMATGADQINTAITQVKEICIKNQKNIEKLTTEVSKFKVD
jgi:methyl-accepting chemotaxis protein